MTPWTRLCKMAIKRHKLFNVFGAFTWSLHEAQIIAVYGPETYYKALRLYDEENP